MKQISLKRQKQKSGTSETSKLHLAKAITRMPVEWQLLSALLLLMALRLASILVFALKQL